METAIVCEEIRWSVAPRVTDCLLRCENRDRGRTSIQTVKGWCRRKGTAEETFVLKVKEFFTVNNEILISHSLSFYTLVANHSRTTQKKKKKTSTYEGGISRDNEDAV